MNDLLPILTAEAAAFLAAADKREYLIVRSEKQFDELIAPVDLPGPDAIGYWKRSIAACRKPRKQVRLPAGD